MLTAETDQVGITTGNGLIGQLGVIDAPHADYRHIHNGFQGAGTEQIETGIGIHRGNSQVAGRGINPHRTVDGIDSGSHHSGRELLHEGQIIPAAHQFICRYANPEREIFTH